MGTPPVKVLGDTVSVPPDTALRFGVHKTHWRVPHCPRVGASHATQCGPPCESGTVLISVSLTLTGPLRRVSHWPLVLLAGPQSADEGKKLVTCAAKLGAFVAAAHTAEQPCTHVVMPASGELQADPTALAAAVAGRRPSPDPGAASLVPDVDAAAQRSGALWPGDLEWT